jgi:pyruvate/2-oxoglutarate dehydrogenase complex dihydrolipoamide acyltransferase (E2) component
VKVGDTVSQGSVVAILESEASASAPAPKPAAPAAATPAPAAPATATPSTTAASASGRKADSECGVVVLGAGPGGYTAAFRAADLGLDVLLVERYDARRRLPQRRLHPVEGAAARGASDRRGRARGRLRHQLRCREDRPRQAARLTRTRWSAAHRRPRRHGQAAQGARGHRASAASSRRMSSKWNRRARRQEAGALRTRDHRRRLAGGEAAGLAVG